METPLQRPELPITPVAHEALKTFPKRGASFDEIVVFAFTFDGYERYGMEACAQLANEALSSFYHERVMPENDLDVLRTCLFFEARRWRHFGMEPEGDARRYIESLLAGIKSCLENGNRT